MGVYKYFNCNSFDLSRRRAVQIILNPPLFLTSGSDHYLTQLATPYRLWTKKTEFLDPTFYLSIWQSIVYVNSWQILRDGIIGHPKNRKGKNREKMNLLSPLECVGVNSLASSQKFSLSLMTTERGNFYPDFGLFF